ncbi:hypothetical protein GF402_04220 [Candidatus Fermentibacteria bacterium]|nr:hypothetical protein [Candidatus Fermentibacteria bacterium]
MYLLILMAVLSGFTTVDRIVAVVGDRPVLHSEVVSELRAGGLTATGAGDVDPESEEYLGALDELVSRLLIVEAARESGLYPSEAESAEMAEERLDSIRAEFESEEALVRTLHEYGITLEGYTERARQLMSDQVAISAIMGRRVSAAFGTIPSNTAGYLDSHRAVVESIAMPRHLRWIYLPVLPDSESFAAQADTLLDLRRKILSGDFSFQDCARTMSDDRSAERGGDLGYFGAGEMTPMFEAAVCTLEVGEISGPVITHYGVHLIELLDRRSIDSTGATSMTGEEPLPSTGTLGQGEQVRARHLLLRLEMDRDDVRRTVERADSIRQTIRSGLGFAEAARLYSMDRFTSDSGGDLGTVLVRAWMPEAAGEIRDLPPGGVSEPVVISDGLAVALFQVLEDEGEIDWGRYADSYLRNLARSVAYELEYRDVVDSLKQEIPVVLYSNED